MTDTGLPAMGRALRIGALVVVAAVITVAVGYLPTKRIGGADAVPAMLAGCSISALGSLVGVIPVALAASRPVRAMPNAILMATALRLAVVAALALAVALSNWFERGPLLIWVAISYVVFLIVDTACAVRLGGSAPIPEKS